MKQKTVKRYEWHHGARFNVNAEVAGKCIEALKNERGEVTPTVLVVAAKATKHPLHPCFEWNDDAAAQAHREEQARRLLRSLRIIHVVVEKGTEKKQTRIAYVNVRYKEDEEEETASVYMDTVQALSKEESREFVLKQALAFLRGFRQRYAALNEFNGVFQEIDKLDEVEKRKRA